MSKKVSFQEQPVLVRQISDQSEARKQNSQTPFENRLASNSFYMEEKRKINTDKETKEKYEKKRDGRTLNTQAQPTPFACSCCLGLLFHFLSRSAPQLTTRALVWMDVWS